MQLLQIIRGKAVLIQMRLIDVGLAALQCLSSAPICVVPWHAVTVLLLGGQVIPANQMQKVMRYLHVQRAVVLTA